MGFKLGHLASKQPLNHCTETAKLKASLLDEVVEEQNDSDGHDEDGGCVSDDNEGGRHSQEAADPPPDDDRHGRIQDVHVFAEPVQDSGTKSNSLWTFALSFLSASKTSILT